MSLSRLFSILFSKTYKLCLWYNVIPMMNILTTFHKSLITITCSPPFFYGPTPVRLSTWHWSGRRHHLPPWQITCFSPVETTKHYEDHVLWFLQRTFNTIQPAVSGHKMLPLSNLKYLHTADTSSTCMPIYIVVFIRLRKLRELMECSELAPNTHIPAGLWKLRGSLCLPVSLCCVCVVEGALKLGGGFYLVGHCQNLACYCLFLKSYQLSFNDFLFYLPHSVHFFLSLGRGGYIQPCLFDLCEELNCRVACQVDLLWWLTTWQHNSLFVRLVVEDGTIFWHLGWEKMAGTNRQRERWLTK